MKPLYSIDRNGRIPRRETTPAEDRAFLIHYARVLIGEARKRRGQRVEWLLAGAARARREAAAIDARPAQKDLFA